MISPIAHLHPRYRRESTCVAKKEQNISIASTLDECVFCISIASILLVTTPAVAVPAVAAVIRVREETPDRPSVVVAEGSLSPRSTKTSSPHKVIRRKAGSQHTLRILGWLHRL